MTENTPKLKICLHYSGMTEPQKANESDSGIDLTLMKVIEKREHIFFFDLGISVEPPVGFYTELYPRSSIYKSDFIMANSVGIIDADYRGIVQMVMRYIGTGNGLEEATKLIGQRIGQLILKKLEPITVEIVKNLNDTNRGIGGFGSSGKK
ncbi:MAG: dUTP pyrophosphatase [bacterium]|jgi:dUTP pyrophosphatase